jgi:hypothetical protein
MPVQIDSEVEWLRTCFGPSRKSFPTWLRLSRYASLEVSGHGSEITPVEGRPVEFKDFFRRHGGTSVS